MGSVGITRDHPMMTSSNGKKISALLTLCAGNSPVTGDFPSQRSVTRSFGVSLGLRLNNRLSKQSWRRWFETPLLSLWRHCNADGRQSDCWPGLFPRQISYTSASSCVTRTSAVMVLLTLCDKQVLWVMSTEMGHSFKPAICIRFPSVTSVILRPDKIMLQWIMGAAVGPSTNLFW